jgi:uncharacterized membrane protein
MKLFFMIVAWIIAIIVIFFGAILTAFESVFGWVPLLAIIMIVGIQISYNNSENSRRSREEGPSFAAKKVVAARDNFEESLKKINASETAQESTVSSDSRQMNDLVQLISNARKEGVPIDKMLEALASEGWKTSDIEEAFRASDPQGESRQKSVNDEVSGKGVLLFISWVIVLCVVGVLLLAVFGDAYPEITFELMATIIIVLTGMIGMQKNYRKPKRSDLDSGEGEVLEEDSYEKNTQEPIQPSIVETHDEPQVEESTLDRKKLKQEQLQKLTFMVKAMSKKGQTEDQIRNNLSQMGWPDKALDQAFSASVCRS